MNERLAAYSGECSLSSAAFHGIRRNDDLAYCTASIWWAHGNALSGGPFQAIKTPTLHGRRGLSRRGVLRHCRPLAVPVTTRQPSESAAAFETRWISDRRQIRGDYSGVGGSCFKSRSHTSPLAEQSTTSL